MKPNIKFNEDFAFLMFIAAFSGALFLLSGASVLSSFLTGIFIYIYLRFTYFLWGIVLRIIDHAGHGGKPDA